MTKRPLHRCPVAGCDRLVSQERLLCWRHWMLVPAPLRLAVFSAFRAKRDTPGPDADWKHAQACRAAIEAVQEKEKPCSS